LELLKDIAPHVSRVSVMFNLTTGVTTEMFFRAVEAAAPQFAVEAIRSDVHRNRAQGTAAFRRRGNARPFVSCLRLR